MTAGLVVTLMAAVAALPARLSGQTVAVRHSSAAFPPGLVQAIHARLGPGPVSLGHTSAPALVATRGGWALEASSMRATIARTGQVAVVAAHASASLTPSELREAGVVEPLPPATSTLHDGQVLTRSGPLTTIDQAVPAGLEQRFVVATPVAPAGSTLVLGLRSPEFWRTVKGGSAISTGDVRYGALSAHDATGKPVPARFTAGTEGPGIRLDVRHATFPITVDPTYSNPSSPSADLTNSPPLAGAHFGTSVALSSDGTTAIVGASQPGSGPGKAYIFHVSCECGFTAADITAVLTDFSGANGDLFGTSVALSADGSTAFVGASGANSGAGRVDVFRASNESTWVSSSFPTATLADGLSSGGFGNSIALSSGGVTALIGASSVSSGQGAAYVYHVNSESLWATTSTPTATLSNSASSNPDQLGDSVSLSADGTTALVGASQAIGGQGVAYIYQVVSQGSWSDFSLPPVTLSNFLGSAGDTFGTSVTLSNDGSTALIGAPGVAGGTNTGAAYVFNVQSVPPMWTTSATPIVTLTNSGATGDAFGISVAFSSDGTAALIGASGVNGQGAAYVFNAPSTEPSWVAVSTFSAELQDGTGNTDAFGTSVALSSDGTLALSGAPAVSTNNGAAYIFNAPTTESSWTNSSSPSATLASGSGSTGDQFGFAVSLSADGTTALVGANGVDSNTGAAYIFNTTNPRFWSSTGLPTAILTDACGCAGDQFGTTVALSSDGTTAFVGAPGASVGVGQVDVFEASSETSWVTSSTPNAFLVDGSVDGLGNSLAVSSDGTTALVGARATSSSIGAVDVFHASTWSGPFGPTATLTNSGNPGDLVGSSVAMSADGTTALVGASGVTGTGVAYVFNAPSESQWVTSSTPAATVSDPAAVTGDAFGAAVGLSADGTVALVGSPDASGGAGATYVFNAPSETGWSTPSLAATLTDGSAPSAHDHFGGAVALTPAGTTALVGAEFASNGNGAADAFSAPSETTWTNSSSPAVLTTSTQVNLGLSVALDQSGITALVGSLSPGVGDAFVFNATFVPDAPATAPTSSAVGNGTVTLHWTAAASNGLPVTGYNVQVSTSSSGPFSNATGCTHLTAVLTCTASGLTNGTGYFFQVQAKSDAGSGPFSPIGGPFTPLAQAPDAPAAPTSSGVGNGTVSVDWVAPNNGGSSITHYNVQVSTSSSGPFANATGCTNLGVVLTCTASGLINGTGYFFKVNATNGVGPSAYSPAGGPFMPAAQAPDAPVAPTSSGVGNGTVTLDWVAPNNNGSAINGYNVQVSTSSSGPFANATGCTNLGVVLTCTASGLTNGTGYFFKVNATNGVGPGAYSPAGGPFTPASPAPSAPSGVTASAGVASATVKWSNGSAGETYAVTPTDLTANVVGAPVAAGTATTLNLGALTVGHAYSFTVVGTVNGNASPASNPSNTVVPTGAAPQSSNSGSASASVGTPGTQGSISATGTGGNASSSITVSQYASNPTAGLVVGGTFFDLLVAPGSTYSSVTATLCGSPGATGVQWWNPNTSSYENVSPATPTGTPGCFSVTFDATSTPSISSLYGTIFVVPSVSAYWLVASDGGVFAFGGAGYFGSMGGRPLAAPIVGITGTPDAGGYWQVASDGGVFAFGDAAFYGSTGGLTLNRPIVGMARTPSGRGYWLVASDGGVFAFGDAAFYGSGSGLNLNGPVVGITATPGGHGYWLITARGGVYTFGDAGFFGSMGGRPLNKPAVAIAATPSGSGYWLVAADGGVFAFGDATFYGSTGSTGVSSAVGAVGSPRGDGGYLLVGADGGVFAFGATTYSGSMSGRSLNAPMVGIAVAG